MTHIEIHSYIRMENLNINDKLCKKVDFHISMVYATFCHLQVIILKSLHRAKYKLQGFLAVVLKIVSRIQEQFCAKHKSIRFQCTFLNLLMASLIQLYNVHMYIPNKIEMKFNLLFHQHSIVILNFILYQFLLYLYFY